MPEDEGEVPELEDHAASTAWYASSETNYEFLQKKGIDFNLFSNVPFKFSFNMSASSSEIILSIVICDLTFLNIILIRISAILQNQKTTSRTFDDFLKFSKLCISL